MKRQIELTDGSVLLRPYRVSDTEHLYQAVRESINELSPWMPWCHADYSIEESRTWIESRVMAWDKGTEYDFVITDTTDGLFLGGCGLNHINHTSRMANLGYWVRTSRTKVGLATVATGLLARCGFENLRLNRIEILVSIDNKASQRVAEKAGAKCEGILRNRLFIHDKFYDAVMFSLIPEDVGLS